MTNDTIGVDISKDYLDAHRMSDGSRRRFSNGKAGHRAFVGWAGRPGARIVYEPTGPYHRAFERGLADAGLALVKVNPRQARRFAEATGRLAKTDRLDAAMLARMGALLKLEARPVRPPILNDLKDLSMAREALVKSCTAAKNRAKNLTLAILKRHNAEQLRQIQRQMAAIETEIMALIKADPDLARRFDIVVSIPGVSAITAFALIIDMPELGILENGQAASLAGLAPGARQSGNWTGRAFMLTVIDEFSRECLAIHVQRQIKSDDVLAGLAKLFTLHGPPEHIRSDQSLMLTAPEGSRQRIPHCRKE